jgi:ABC-type amino acid transport substrate-binding protein
MNHPATKKIALSILTVCVSIGINAQIPKLKLASDNWPPFTNKNVEKSLALAIVTEALSRNQVEVVHEIMEFDLVLNQITNGEIDGSGALWKTDEREEIMLFSEPYLENRLVLLGLKGKDVSFTNLDGLKGQKIGLVKNYAYDENLFSAVNLEVVHNENDQENLEKLLERKIDYMLVDELLIQYMLKYQLNDVNEYLSISKRPIQIKKLFLAIRNDIPNASKIISDFNNSIDQMILDGSYTKMLNLQSIQTDVNGDGIYELVINSDYVGEESPHTTYALFYDQSTKGSETQYHIDGKIYNNWEQIPKESFKSPVIKLSDDIYHSGLRIKMN